MGGAGDSRGKSRVSGVLRARAKKRRPCESKAAPGLHAARELGIFELGYDAGQVLGLRRQLGNSLAGFAHCL